MKKPKKLLGRIAPASIHGAGSAFECLGVYALIEGCGPSDVPIIKIVEATAPGTKELAFLVQWDADTYDYCGKYYYITDGKSIWSCEMIPGTSHNNLGEDPGIDGPCDLIIDPYQDVVDGDVYNSIIYTTKKWCEENGK